MSYNNYWQRRMEKWTELDPLEIISEILFGLIMVLTFTCTISVTVDYREDVRSLLWAALGCNFAWGVVDAIMHLMNIFLGRGHDVMQINKIRSAGSIDESREIARDSISPLVSELISDNSVDEIVHNLKQIPKPEFKNVLTIKDFTNALEIFLLVFASTFPVVIPFIFFNEVSIAMRLSNGIALLLMFIMGYKIAGYSGFNPLHTALIFVSLGVFLVMITIALGG